MTVAPTVSRERLWWTAACVALAVAMSALLIGRLSVAPVDPYGADGAAWLEHQERVEVALAFQEMSVAEAVRFADGAFPPGLYLISLLPGYLGFDEGVVAGASLVWWLLLALAIGGCAKALSGRADLFAVGCAFGLVLPVGHAAGVRYYFDLPTATLMWLGVWALLRWRAERPVFAGVLCALLMMVSCIVKWPTLAYGPPLIIGAALAGPRSDHAWRRPWLAGVVAALAWVGLLLLTLHLLGPHNSMTSMIGETFSGKLGVERETPRTVFAILSMLLEAGQAQVGRLFGPGISFYPYSLVYSVWSPALCLVAMPFVAAWLLARSPGGGFVWLALLGHGLLVVCVIPVFDDRFLLPVAPLGPLVAALGWPHIRADLRNPMAAVVVAAGLWVAVDFHAGPATEPTIELIGDDRAFEPLEAFGWGLACSLEHRGWARLNHPGAPRRGALRQAVSAQLLETEFSAVGFSIEQPLIDRYGDETYFRFLGQRRGALTGVAMFDTVPICPLPRHAADPFRPFDLALAPAGQEPAPPPCLDASQWTLETLVNDPDGGDGVGFWRRIEP